MKILLLHSKYKFQGGEDAVVIQELELLRKYHEVDILYFQNHGSWKGALQFLGSIWNIFSTRKLKQKIEEFKPDVVHVHNWHFGAGPLVFRIIYDLKIPIVHTIHNYRLLCLSAILLHRGKLFNDSLYSSFPWKAVKNKVYRSSFIQTFWLAFIVWFHKKIGTWKKVDTYICLTSFAVDLFQQSNFGISKNKFTIKPNFLSNHSELGVDLRGDHFLFIGRLSEEKGVAILLEAFKELPYKLKIAGEGPFKDVVIKTSQKCSNIIYLGNLSNTSVINELKKTQALIFPSIWFEGMPMTILEAFSVSTPVIASNLGAMTSLISNNSDGLLFEPANVNDLKKCIVKFERLSSDRKRKLRENAFNTYRTMYSSQLQKKYFDDIYQKAVKKNNI